MARLREKRIKDGADLIALLDPNPPNPEVHQNFNVKIFNEIVDNKGLKFCIENVEALPEMNESMVLYRNVKREYVERWISPILQNR